MLRVLALGKGLRGTVLDPFGHTSERRMERQLIAQYTTQLQQLLPRVHSDNVELVREILALPLSIRGFGHVKERNMRAAQIRQAWLLHRLDPAQYPRPQESNGAQQLRGIPIRSA
jgi:indolepyruvate ferredoxin oxidoreductase